MKNIYVSLILICMFACTLNLNALSLYDFSKHTLSVRSHGMGMTGVALADDESATISNPAALSYNGAAYSFQRLDYDSLKNRLYQAHYYYSRPFGFASIIKEDDSGDKLTMNALGFGFFGGKEVSWGVNYKSIYGTFEGDRVEGWSSDLGLLFRLFPTFHVGVNVKDIYSKNLDLDHTAEVGFTTFLSKNRLALSYDLSYENDDKKELLSKVGGELVLTDSLTLRSGMFGTELFAGASLKVPFISLDFGMSNDYKDIYGTHYSVSFKLGPGSQFSSYRKRYALYKRDAYAEFAIGSNIKKGKSEISLFGGYKIGSNDLLTLINIANQDDSCKGYIIRMGNLSSSITTVGLIEEIRSELLKAKDDGKQIFVYLDGYVGLPEYYLASIADMIMMPPLGSVSQFGLNLEISKAESFLKKLGISKQIVESGEQKSATDTFSEQLTDFDSYQLKGVLEDIFDKVVQDIVDVRPEAKDGILQISDGSMITAKEAKALDLADRVVYWPDVYSLIDDYDTKTDRVAIESFVPLYQPSIFHYFNKIAVIEIDGPIVQGKNSSNVLFGGYATGAEDFDAIVDNVKDNPSYKGVVLRVNSPGGSVIASDQIYMAVRRLKRSGKLVYTSMGSISTSGGYYVSSNSDRIFSNYSTLTGSIGVISSWWSLNVLNSELGIDNQSIKTGKYMGIYSPTRYLSQQDLAMLEQNQDTFYQEFVQKVRMNRNLSFNESYSLAQGQIFSGNQAQQVDIVDEIGGLYDAVSHMSDELDIQSPEVVFLRPVNDVGFPGYVRQASQLLYNHFQGLFSIKSLLNKLY